jgi:hypothetical protein
MNAKVKTSLEKKQIIKAVKALKEYVTKTKNDDLGKKLLGDEDNYVYVTFTLTEVPTKPTPRP